MKDKHKAKLDKDLKSAYGELVSAPKVIQGINSASRQALQYTYTTGHLGADKEAVVPPLSTVLKKPPRKTKEVKVSRDLKAKAWNGETQGAKQLKKAGIFGAFQKELKENFPEEVATIEEDVEVRNDMLQKKMVQA